MMYYYSLTFRSLNDGRSFSQEIKTPKKLNSDTVKSLYESKCNVELVAFKENTYFESSYLDNQKNLTYSGLVTVQGFEIPVHKKLLPLYKDLNFDILDGTDLKSLETFLKNFYGDTFSLKTVRFD